jgi:hypothetical protein
MGLSSMFKITESASRAKLGLHGIYLYNLVMQLEAGKWKHARIKEAR